MPIDEGDVHGRAVCDVTGDPAGTALIAAARRGGARTIDGLDVLVSRTARQFEWWTGSSAPAGAMRDAARRHSEALERGMREST